MIVAKTVLLLLLVTSGCGGYYYPRQRHYTQYNDGYEAYQQSIDNHNRLNALDNNRLYNQLPYRQFNYTQPQAAKVIHPSWD